MASINGFRLSPQQEHLWLLCGRESASFFARCRVNIHGPFRADALAEALDRAVERYEILRTYLHAIPGQKLPFQVIRDTAKPRFQTVDLSGEEPVRAQERLAAELAAMPRASRDVETESPLEATLAILGPTHHVLLLALPAFYGDGASLVNLVRNLAADLGGREILPPDAVEPMQYADIAQWQRDLLDSPETLESRKFWRGCDVAGGLDSELPFDRPAGFDPAAAEALTVAAVPVTLPDALQAALAAFSEAQGSSVVTVLLACWRLLLGRVCEGDVPVVGVAFAGRRYDELVGAVGLLSRFLPMPGAGLEADRSLAEVVVQTRDTAAGYEEWQEFFDWRNLPRPVAAKGRKTPAFTISHEKLPVPLAAGAATLEVDGLRVVLEPCELQLAVSELPDGVQAELLFDRSRYRREDIERLGGWLETLLGAAVAAPRSPIGCLPLASRRESEWMLREVNATTLDLGGDTTLHRLFAEQVERCPERVALESETGTLTYGGVYRAVKGLARALRQAGVRPEVPVGLALERSLEMVVAMLAIHEAGGGYVPLDLSLPEERLVLMASDTGMPLVVTRQRFLAALAKMRCKVLPVEELLPGHGGEVAGAEEPGLPDTRSTPDNLAYLIYTSGSTGRPKGVAVGHRAIVNRLLWMQHTFPIGDGDAVLQKTPFSFDASIWELFVPLLVGAKAVLMRPDGHRDTANILSELATKRCTVLQLVPSQLSVFLQTEGVAAGCRSLRRMFCGGEVLSDHSRRRCLELGFDLVNLYGPTEGAIDATFHPCDERSWGISVPIGSPLANVRAYLLDPQGRPTLPGLAGELYIAGAGLARGYVTRPGLTAERFVPDPFGARPGERLYRTGDLVRLHPEGVFEFLRRVDRQVKLRGFRIELGEIEAVLLTHPALAEAVLVHQRAEESSDLGLVAYVVAAARVEKIPSEEELKQFIGERLPEYMVPAMLFFLAEMPRLPSGKLDRNGLPDPKALRAGRRGDLVAPRTPMEKALAEIWQELLALDAVGIDEDFFEIGGHSLLATQLVSRIRRQLGVELKVRQLFRAPTLEAVARELDRLMAGSSGADLAPIPRLAVGQPAPLSFAQARLWFLQHMEPQSSAYHLPAAVHLAGKLDLAALEASLQTLVRRHEGLLTSFPAEEGHPVQVLGAVAPGPLPLIDLSALPAALRSRRAEDVVEELALRPFDLARGPVLRYGLVRLSETEHQAVLSLHHIVSDGWSTEILIRELMELFTAAARGETASLPPLPLRYVDYAAWQRAQLQGDGLEQHLRYWREQLAGELPQLRLPFDRPRSAVRTGKAAGTSFRLPLAELEAIRAFALGEESSLFMALLSAFKILAHRYSGQRDLIVGTPVANRNRQEIEPLVGMFVSSLVLRTRWSGEPTVRELLGLVREMTLDSMAHGEMPLEKLVDELLPTRRSDVQPFYQVMLMLQNFPEQQEFKLHGLEVIAKTIGSKTAKFDLLVELRESDDGLFCGLEYRAELFDATTVQRLGRHLKTMMRALVAFPDQRLAALSLLDAAERHQIALEWNDTAYPFPEEVRLNELFEQQVQRGAAALAATDGNEGWTYGEIDALANRLARHLRERGVARGDLVGVYLERSLEMIPALLGILKVGAAYVPLDIEYPAARLQHLLAALELETVVTQTTGVPVLAGLRDVPRLSDLICLDRKREVAAGNQTECRVWLREHLERLSPVAPPPVGGAADLAYVIFTSGSTGTPKGVMMRHRPVVNLIHWFNRKFAISASDRLLFITSLCFDLSVYDVFGVLAAGGSVRVALREEARDPERLVRILEREPITLWDSAPAALQQLVAFFPVPQSPPRSSTLRRVFLSGDWVPLGLPEQMRKSFPGTEIVALGGATEAAIWSNYCLVTEVAPHWVSIPYGRPIENAHYHALDASLEPCPIGVEGDLFIGDRCLFSGYVFGAGENAVRSIPDAMSGRPGARLYRTGDRIKRWADGTMEFLGRRDHQVKIRGFRIELGEIEAQLLRHAEVAEAVVIAREDVPGEKRLVAYVVARHGGKPDPSDLRRHLAERLPEYMVPAAFLTIDSVPVTANGKLDRNALPAPQKSRRAEERFVAPRDAAEAILSRIWSEVLHLEGVGVHDNFFELGGDSILSIQTVTRARQAGLRLDPRDLFEYQTIAELVAVAGSLEGAILAQEEVVGPVPLTPIQHWFLAAEPVAPHFFNQAVLLETVEPLDAELVADALAELLRHHDILRARFECQGAGWSQEIQPAGRAVGFSQVRLAGDDAAARKAAVEGAAAALAGTLDLTAGPLVRLALFELGEAEAQRLLFLVHHLVVDGVSWRVLLEDFFTIYGQLAQGEAVALPAKTTSYLAWAESLAEAATAETSVAERLFWQAQLEPAPPALPRDFPAGANTVASARRAATILGEEETRALLHEIPKDNHAQVRDLLLTSLARCLARWTSSDRALIEVEGHGREAMAPGQDLSRTVGWFTAIYPLLFELGGIEGGTAALKRVKETLRRAPRGGVGYGVLRYLGARGPQALPASRGEVIFNYLGQLDQALPASSPVRLARESAGPTADPRQQRHHVLDFSASVSGRRLHLGVTYSENLHCRETMEALLADYEGELLSLIADCHAAKAPAWTPADFPLAALGQSDLDRLLARQPGLEDLYPLSPLQEGFLFHCFEAESAGVYQQQLSCTLRGVLDVPAFERAWQELCGRQTALRTAFLWEDLERPLQVVQKQVDIALEQLDWSALGQEERAQRLDAFLAEGLRRALPLDRAPLMRISLLRMHEDEHVFVWLHHHLIVDGWSVGRLIHEVFELYGAQTEGRETRLERARPYRDYIQWLWSQDREHARSFWRQQLEGFTTPTPVGDRAAETSPYRGHLDRERDLSKPATQKLREWTKHRKLTLATLVEAAWAIVLSRTTGHDDVVFGAVSAGRPPELPGIEEMVGLFITSLPVRARVRASTEVLPFLEDLQRRQVRARQYEYCPLIEIQGWSDVAAGQPLFDSLVVFENYPVPDFVQGQGAAEVEVLSSQFVTWNHYPLTLVANSGDALSLMASWDARRYEPEAVERLLGQLHAVIEGFTTDARRVSDLELLTEAERQQLLCAWNQGESRLRPFQDLAARIDAQADARGEAPAVTLGGEVLSHAELRARSNQLAYHLRALGVRSESRVGVLLGRTPETVVVLLAVLKAGAAYLPLEPTLPRQRLELMIGDADLTLVVTSGEPARRLADLRGPRVLDLTREREQIARQPERAPETVIDPDQLAYVLYTSGSTGRPKGVQVTRQAMASYVASAVEGYGLSSGSRAAVHSPLAFDLTVTALFAPLAAGGSIVLLPDSVGFDELGETLRQGGYSFLKLTPAHLELLGHGLDSGSLPVEVLVIGGEALWGESLRPWREHCADIRLINEYGPTEATVGCISYEVPAGRPAGGPVPIGRSMPNMRHYLLDEALCPLPIGVAAGLYLAGAGLARGYLGRPGLTAERFLPDPFAARPGERMYRTGDLAQYRPDGNLEFLGRNDHQVKIRGYRVELGEIETILRRHGGLREVAVGLTGETSGKPQLVAYLAAEATMPSPEELAAYLAGYLPEYMVPTLFIPLDEMPLTINGKVDRGRLPSPLEMLPAALAETSSAPTNETEARLAEIWAEVLGRERVGIHDNFFTLGGDSILGLQIASRARRVGIKLAARKIFEYPTVATLAAVAEVQASAAPAAGAPAAPVPPRGEVPLTPIQSWFFEQDLVAPHHFNQALLLTCDKVLDADRLERAAKALVAHHESLRLRFSRCAEGWRQTLGDGAEGWPLTRVDLSDLPADGFEEALSAECNRLQASLDLGLGPLARLGLFALPEGLPSRLLVVAHHLVVDAVSWGYLLADLMTVYDQLTTGAQPALPARATSFPLWADHLKTAGPGFVSPAERAYWEGVATAGVANPPLDDPLAVRAALGEAASLSIALDAATTRALLEQAPRGYQTGVDALLLTALVEAMAQATGKRRLMLDLEGHGREDLWAELDLSRTVGWFTVLYPMVLDLESAADVGTAIQTTREQLRAVPSHGLGWGILRYLDGGSESAEKLRVMAPPEILFNYLGQVDRGLPTEQSLALAPESPGSARDSRQRRSHRLEINALVSGGQLRMGWTYDPGALSRQTVEAWAQGFLAQLRRLVEHCVAVGRRSYRLAQIAPHGLRAEELERILDRIEGWDAEGVAHLEVIYPLSPGQEGMLYESLANPGLGMHVEQWSCQLEGELDLEMFDRAWAKVSQRHDMLRTAFLWQDLESPQQVVFDRVPLGVEHLDWRQLQPAEHKQRLTEYLIADAARGFDLSRPPLLRVVLIRLGERRSRLIWTHHHILLDGWCRVRVLDEVLRAYATLVAGGSVSTPPAVQYRTYVEWLERQDLAAAERYWRGALDGFSRPTALGREAVPLAREGARYRAVSLDFGLAESEGLRGFAQRYGLTLNTLMQAAWGLVLNRYSGGDRRVLFGITVSGRPEELAGIEETVGLFTNTLPLALTIDSAQPLTVWLAQIQTANLDLRQYEFAPGVALRKWSQIPSRDPLYHSIVVFENYPQPSVEQTVSGRSALPALRDVEVEGARTQYAATLLVHPTERLNLRLVADTSRLEADGLPRILEDVWRVLAAFLEATAETSVGAAAAALGEAQAPAFASRGGFSSLDGERAIKRPRTPTEELVAGIWAEVLGVPQISLDDNFFVLGGHSLVATQMISRLSKVFSKEIPLRIVFETGNVEELALHIDEEIHRAGSEPVAPPIEVVARDEELPLSFAEQRLWFLDHWDPGKATFNIPVALRLVGEIDLSVLEQVLGEVSRRHESLRTTFPTVDGRPVRVIASPDRFTLPVVDVAGEAETEVRRRVEEEARRPFDLARGPLLRARVFRCHAREHVLVFTVHHIISDAWSAMVVGQEVAALALAFGAGKPSPLPECTWQYADFAAWQRRWLSGEVRERQLAWWKRQLGGDLPLTELPGDRPRPAAKSQLGATLQVVLPEALADRLRALGRQQGSTLFMTLLSVWNILLKQRTRQEELVVGTDVANRNRLETEGIVGFFVNQLALRTRLDGNPPFSELLERVRQVTLGAYAHQDLPFDQLVDGLGIERSFRYAPIFQVKLFVTNAPRTSVSPEGLDVQPFEIELGAAQLDLTVAFQESHTGPIAGWANYSTDLFDDSTIVELMAAYEALLEQVVSHPQNRLDTFEDFLAERDRKTRRERMSWKPQGVTKFKAVSPRKVTAPVGELVKIGSLGGGDVSTGPVLPLLIEPALDKVDLADWAAANHQLVQDKLLEYGAVLFRGFGIDSPPRLERFAATVCKELFNENGEHPRDSVSGNVYTPVFYPKDQKLLMHNENSFNHQWPTKILFSCETPAAEGGETPLADSRRVLERLSPEIVRKFEELGVMYVRNYGNQGIGLSWQQIFQTEERSEVEAIFRRTGVQWEWRDGDRLCTRMVRPAILRHPVTGEKTWFNQAQHWHIACLDEETRVSMQSIFAQEDLPRHCYFGDGSAIADETMVEILAVYDALEVSFPWQRGDVVLLDNVLVAHARNPFVGARKILVALGDMSSFEDAGAQLIEVGGRRH